MAGQEDQDAQRGCNAVLSWYDRTRPMFIDLVGDYAGKELFLVEGDSLLRQCFEDERIDFQDGFQLLHAVYVVERFLENLVKRHCQFHIAFFEENAELCMPPRTPGTHRFRYLLARSIIKRHLAVHLPDTHPNLQVNVFLSLKCSEFQEYLRVCPIHFVMAHDGSPKSIASTPAVQLDEDAPPPEDDERWTKILLRGMIRSFNVHRLNVALINRIEFRDSKVFTMIVESFTPPTKLKLTMNSTFGEEIANAKKLLEDSRKTSEIEAAFGNQDLEEVSEAFAEVDLNESYCLVVYAVSKILKQQECDVFLASAFVLHSVIIKHIPLYQRRLPLITFDADFEEQIDSFLAAVSEVCRNAVDNGSWNQLMASEEFDCDSIDLIDGRLFRAALQAMCDDSLHVVVPRAAQSDWALLSGLVKELGKEILSLAGSSKPASSKSTAKETDFQLKTEELTILPFTNKVFDKHLECIHVKTEDSLPARFGALKIYRRPRIGTIIGSHSTQNTPPLLRLPSGSMHSTFSDQDALHGFWPLINHRNPLRTNQFYMKEMTTYAASLTGAKGKALEPETITVGAKRLVKLVEKAEKAPAKPKKEEVQERASQNQSAGGKKGTKKAASGLSKKEQMIADNKEKKGSSEADKAFTAWSTIMKGLDAVLDHQDRYLKTLDYLNALDSAKTAFLEADVSTYMLQSLLNWWVMYCKGNKKIEGYFAVALIWTTVRTICTSGSPISTENIHHVTKLCTLLGITNALTPFDPTPTDRKLSFVFKYPPPTQDLRIEVSQTEFQLNYCGPYMDRMLDAKPDPRVPSFVPDGWQREVLDQLDANKSVFVVAPTSAGKTFISFYAMEQVLRADNDGVLVYVAPTKALVNQIAAEIQGRFSKKFPIPGKSVWAIHTRDYRVNNSTGCQILVTVPHILQIMLLSPSNAKAWAPRVRRIIFDEIHSIGQAEDGVVWEQLLLLAPCPIIALSATVGNPDQFNDWLKDTQKALGSDLKMIKHSTRYSDLRKYMYEPPTVFKFTGLGRSYGVGLGLDGLLGFDALHPVSSLVDKSRGMPDDLALEPRDCLSLWKAMCKFQNSKYPVPESLNPEEALPACIRKADIFAWEKDLKKLLLQWLADKNSPIDKVVKELTPTTTTPNLLTSDKVSSSNSLNREGFQIDSSDLKSTTLPLLYQLHKRRALPAILFNYDRSQCEKIAEAVLKQLVAAELLWKEGTQWKKLMEGYEKYKEQKDKKSRKPAKPSKKTKGEDDEGGSKVDRMREESSEGASGYDLFDPEAPQEDFSFANPKALQKAELEEYICALRWKNVNEELLDLLRRGIGVHHAGMNRKYRQCVEMLFRRGFLRVVIATGTLSMGINMPCVTVVFCGNSVYLTALNFRQAAGRSGRRGFDLLGNVVFQGVSRERASRLLSSRLPELTGHFPITTTLVLRLFTLLHDSKSSPYAERAINSLLSQPRLYLGGQSFKEQVLHHLRFSIEYLRRNELLGPNGGPVNFTSCVSHLYYTENSSFAFHALLKGGYFHKLCADIDTKTTIVLDTLILVLCHLFGRRVCREVDDPEEAEKIKYSPSVVYLKPMPQDAAKILRQHNADTLDVFTTYVKTFAAQHIKEEECYLPLTNIPAGFMEPAINGKAYGHATANGSAHTTKPAKEDEIFDFLPSLPVPHARSTFFALSGLGDEFSTIDDLCSSTREGVFLESAVIPHLEIHPDENRTPLNAYILDFYMHGSLDPLERANGIRKSDVWFLLNDFSMVLATILTSIALHLGLGNDADPEMLDVMGAGDAAENDADEQVAAATIPDAPEAAAVTAQAAAPVRKSKKVVDDWDAGEDALVAQEDYLKSEGLNGTGATDDEEYEKLMNVYKAFRQLKSAFDEKFHAIFA